MKNLLAMKGRAKIPISFQPPTNLIQELDSCACCRWRPLAPSLGQSLGLPCTWKHAAAVATQRRRPSSHRRPPHAPPATRERTPICPLVTPTFLSPSPSPPVRFLAGLQAHGDESRQLQSLMQLCEMRSIGSEDLLAGRRLRPNPRRDARPACHRWCQPRRHAARCAGTSQPRLCAPLLLRGRALRGHTVVLDCSPLTTWSSPSRWYLLFLGLVLIKL
jgi:hypothetical protein